MPTSERAKPGDSAPGTHPASSRIAQRHAAALAPVGDMYGRLRRTPLTDKKQKELLAGSRSCHPATPPEAAGLLRQGQDFFVARSRPATRPWLTTHLLTDLPLLVRLAVP